MRVFQRLFEFYITSSVHVSLAAVAFTIVTFLSFDIGLDYNILIFIGLATITGYNFVKYFGLAKFHHRRLAKWLKVIQIFSLLSIIAMFYFTFLLDLRTLIYLFVLGLITFLYAVPLIPNQFIFDENRNLRQIGGIKIYVIAFVWTAVTVGLPIFIAEKDLTFDIIITCIQRFLLVIVLTLPFEIRDLNYDSLKLSTIPQKIGVKSTKVMGVVLVVLSFNLELFKDQLTSNYVTINIIMTLVIILLVIASKKNQSKYYSSFLVEGVPIIWLLLMILFC